MKTMTRLPFTTFFAALLATSTLAASMLLGGCAASSESIRLYDLGPVDARPLSSAPALPAISVAEARVPAWLDSHRMFYRLNYANEQQPRAYADSKWTMPPGQLFVQRLKSRLSQAGGTVVPAADGALNLPVLTLEADDFSQVFDRAGHSSTQIAIRASLFDGRFLRAQKMFVRQIP
ncbi:MAG TPA: ABC-type transport auxiliary lipoprotein family protein, partial [Oxalicibacterium sp.]|nr:ABC-type transport auxiliary lipoprotein family protein [Oxalicibacterium sp.]